MKDLHAVGKIKARNDRRMAIYESVIMKQKSYKIAKNWNFVKATNVAGKKMRQ